MYKKFGFITLLSTLVVVLTAAAVSATDARLALNPTSIGRDFHQDDWEKVVSKSAMVIKGVEL